MRTPSPFCLAAALLAAALCVPSAARARPAPVTHPGVVGRPTAAARPADPGAPPILAGSAPAVVGGLTGGSARHEFVDPGYSMSYGGCAVSAGHGDRHGRAGISVLAALAAVAIARSRSRSRHGRRGP